MRVADNEILWAKTPKCIPTTTTENISTIERGQSKHNKKLNIIDPLHRYQKIHTGYFLNVWKELCNWDGRREGEGVGLRKITKNYMGGRSKSQILTLSKLWKK